MQAVVHLLFLLCFAVADCSVGAEIQQLALIVKQFAALYLSLPLSFSLSLSLSLSLFFIEVSLSLPVSVPLMYLSPSRPLRQVLSLAHPASSLSDPQLWLPWLCSRVFQGQGQGLRAGSVLLGSEGLYKLKRARAEAQGMRGTAHDRG